MRWWEVVVVVGVGGFLGGGVGCGFWKFLSYCGGYEVIVVLEIYGLWISSPGTSMLYCFMTLHIAVLGIDYGFLENNSRS